MKYLLKIYDQKREIATIKFDTFFELLLHLIDRCDHYFYWPEVDEKDCKGLPTLDYVDTVEDLDKILNAQYYEWYRLKVYKIKN